MKKIIFLMAIVFLSSGFSQEQSMEKDNPCEDKRYLKISEKSLDDMSDREYSYFIEIDRDCKNLSKNNSSIKKNIQNQTPIIDIDSLKNSTLDEKSKYYNNEKLSIDLINKAKGGYNSGFVSGETWQKWTAYKGFEKLSEEEFFSLAGFDEQAFKAKSFRKKNINFVLGGLTGMILGWINWHNSIEYSDASLNYSGSNKEAKHYAYEEKADAAFNRGFLIGTIGFGFALYGLMELDKNWSPYTTVKGIAEQYNNDLSKKIYRDER